MSTRAFRINRFCSEPGCHWFGAEHSAEHPCGNLSERPGEACRHCGREVSVGEVACPKCWVPAVDALGLLAGGTRVKVKAERYPVECQACAGTGFSSIGWLPSGGPCAKCGGMGSKLMTDAERLDMETDG